MPKISKKWIKQSLSNMDPRDAGASKNGYIFLLSIGQRYALHWCLAANIRIDIYNGEIVFNRLPGNGWSDIDDFFGRPPWNFDSIKCWKNQPSSTSVRACAQNSHYAYSGFWLILVQIWFGFCVGPNISVRHWSLVDPKVSKSIMRSGLCWMDQAVVGMATRAPSWANNGYHRQVIQEIVQCTISI